MKWIDERGRLGGGPVHLFDLFLFLAVLFLLISSRLPGTRAASVPSRGDIAAPVRTTRSLVGKMMRPVLAVLDDVFLLVPDLDAETAKKIRIGHKDATHPQTVVEITDIQEIKSETRKPGSGPRTRPAGEADDRHPVRLRLRIQSRIHSDRRIGPGDYFFYKGKPLKPNGTYRFVGPGYVLTGPIIHMDDFDSRRPKKRGR